MLGTLEVTAISRHCSTRWHCLDWTWSRVQGECGMPKRSTVACFVLCYAAVTVRDCGERGHISAAHRSDLSRCDVCSQRGRSSQPAAQRMSECRFALPRSGSSTSIGCLLPAPKRPVCKDKIQAQALGRWLPPYPALAIRHAVARHAICAVGCNDAGRSENDYREHESVLHVLHQFQPQGHCLLHARDELSCPFT